MLSCVVRRFQASLQDRLRQRELAGSERAGRYARSLGWDRQWSFIRRSWPWLLALVLLTTVASGPFVVLHPGRVGWAVFGGSVATGFWLAVLLVVLGSGAANQLSV